MNQKKAKLLRKWARKKGYGYPAVKKLYLSYTKEAREILSQEMTAYLRNDLSKSAKKVL